MEAAFEVMGRFVKRVSPGAESACFSEGATLLEVASLFTLALPVTAGFGDAGAAFEAAGRLLKRVSLESDAVSLAESSALRGEVSGARVEIAAVAVEETDRLTKGVSAEPEAVFSTGGGTFREDAPSLAVDVTVEAAVVVVADAEEAERLLKRVPPELETLSLPGDGFSFTGAVILRDAALGVGAGAALFGGVAVPSFAFSWDALSPRCVKRESVTDVCALALEATSERLVAEVWVVFLSVAFLPDCSSLRV